MFALSTAWNADRWQNGEEIAREIYSLGIRSIELNFSLTRKMVEDIYKVARQKEITITSLHNYCPIPEGLTRLEALPDYFSLSALNEDERKKAVECTKISVDTAKKLKARAVVLHTGRVEMEDRTRALIDLSKKKLNQSEEYRQIFKNFLRERKEKSADYFAQILKSLTELSAYALKSGIKLGVENRFYYREIPTLEEFTRIFDTLKNDTLIYWHDVGHAYIHEQLGFMKKNALLLGNKNRLGGTHLHNIKEFDDHQAPVDGEFDFNCLRPFVGPRTIKVIEAHSKAAPEAIKRSIAYLTEVFK